MIGDFRGPADRAEIDCVVLADFGLPVLRHHLAVLFVIVPGREVEMVEMYDHAVLFRGRLQHAQALRDHFLTDAVAGNNRDPIGLFCVAHAGISSLDAASLMPFIWTFCNGPNIVTAQRCSAMLTIAAPSAYQFRRPSPISPY